MSDGPVRLALVGTGIAARILHAPALVALGDRFEVVAVANRTPEKAEAFRRELFPGARVYRTLDEVLADPRVEAVDLLLPIAQTAAAAVATIRAGKHLITEKPVAASTREGEEVLAAAAGAKAVAAVAENYRFQPRFRTVRAILGAGDIGAPRLITWSLLWSMTPENPYAKTDWRAAPAFPGGFVLDGGVHAAAVLNLVAGPARSAQAIATRLHSVDGLDNTVSAGIEFASGTIAHLLMTWGARDKEPDMLRVFGDEGEILAASDRIEVRTPAGTREHPVDPGADGYREEFEDFYEAIRAQRPPGVTIADAFDDMAVIEAILASAASGHREPVRTARR